MLLALLLLACRSDTGLVASDDTEETGAADTPVDTDTPVDSDSPVDTDSPVDSDTPADTDTPVDSDSPVDSDPPPPTDADGDGHPVDLDCDDLDPAVHPGAAEACDGRDVDCVPGNEAAACGCTEHTFEGHTYAFCPVHLDWAGGRATCQLLGKDLVFVDSSGENALLSSTGQSVHPGLTWWTGLTDAASEGAFTSPAGLSSPVDAWCPGEPNNAHGGECSAQTAENCVVLDWCAAGGWNDLPCDCAASHIGFICEG